MELFNPSALASQIFWLVVFFSAQYLILAKLIAPKLKEIFDKREAHINKEIALAEELTNKANELKKSFEEKLEQAQTISMEKMNEAIFLLKKSSEKQLAILEDSLAQDNLKQELRMQKFCFDAKEELEKISLETASMMIDKITGKKVVQTDLEKYLEKVEE